MSKAFTKDDDDAGFVAPPTPPALAMPAGPLRLTSTGARRIASLDGGAAILARAESMPAVVAPQRAALGVTVIARDGEDVEHHYRLVSSEERTLVGEGCSAQSPVGRALLGARVGDVREVVLPRGPQELTVTALLGEPD